MTKFWALFDKGLLALYSVFYALIVIRILPKSEYGLLVLVLNLFGWAKIVINSLGQRPLSHFIAADVKGEERKYTITNAIGWNVSISVILSIFFILSIPFFNKIFHTQRMGVLINFIPLLIAANFFQDFCIAILRGLLRMGRVVIIDATRIFFSILLISIYIMYDKLNSSEAVLMIYIISFFMASIAGLVMCRDSFRLSTNFHWELMKKQMHFGKYLFGINLGTLIYMQTDIFMLGALLNPAAVAIYGVARRMSEFLRSFSEAMAMVISPQAAALSAKKDKKALEKLLVKNLAQVILVFAPTSLILILSANFIFNFFFDGKYNDSIIYFQLLTAIMFFSSVTKVIGPIIANGLLRPDINFKFLWIASLSNIILNFLFIPVLQIHGAIIATAACIMINLVSLFIFVIIKLEISILEIGKDILFNMMLTFKMVYNRIKREA
jgi:O-antigen/teichoic acid export membrane protein